MNSIYRRIITIVTLLISLSGYGQQLSQTIRGVVTDQDTRATLPGAKVTLLTSDPQQKVASDMDGNYRLENVPVGRASIKVEVIGYEPKTVPNILVGSGKEVILNIELTESVEQLQNLVVKADEGNEVLNDMSLLSARTFSVEETSRYAGAISDPARAVSAFAGVTGNAEGDNDIMVRGNSSKGVLWMLEGVPIPNPNHFSFEGGTGGPINALSSNMLSNSDFYTGAFAPEYGNATSAVFDMRLRNGNNEKREYSIGTSILGLDATAEGPFKKGYNGSYVANYRYSSLTLLDQSGIVDFDGIPNYQDASFKFLLPAGKKHTFSLFGFGGLNSISQEGTEEENPDKVTYRSEYKGKLGAAGLSHTYLISNQTYLKSIVSMSGTQNESFYDIPDNNDELYNAFNQDFSKVDSRLQVALNHKFNAKNKIKVGGLFTNQSFDFFSNNWDFELGQLVTTTEQKGTAQTLQLFGSWKHRFNKQLSIVSGAHYLHYLYNNTYAIEPRAAMKWNFRENQAFTLGAGLHSRTESISIYLAEQRQPDGSLTRPNENIDLGKAAHFVLGYDYNFTPLTHLRVEAYYQHLYDIPVEDDPTSTFSLLNSRGWFTSRTLSNEGTGKNYGLEFTLERSFNNGLYYMGTASLYKSLYTAADGVERNGRFDGGYVVNFLGGKEFKMGKKDNNRVWFVNGKVALIGGQRYTPIDLEASQALGEGVRDESNPFSAKGDDVFKLDVAIGTRKNRKRTSSEFKIDVQNASANRAVVSEYYDASTEKIVVSRQLPLLPVISYKLSF